MKKVISFIVSLLILAIIYWRIDFTSLIEVLANSDSFWLIISLGMVVPITLLIAWKLQMLMPAPVNLSFYHSTRLILLASVLNMVLPSKMGDVAKAYFIKDMGKLSGSMSLSLVVFEKVFDMHSLLLWCSFGLLLYPEKSFLFWTMTGIVISGLIVGILLLGSQRFAGFFFSVILKLAPKKFLPKVKNLTASWHEYRGYIWNNKPQLIKVGALSIITWFFHLLQIWFFIFALKSWVPLTVNLALAPLSILAGLFPLTFAGVGTRDAALIFFFQAYLTTPTAAALGILCTIRYLMPAIGGIPFLWKYSNRIQSLQSRSIDSEDLK
ncbi:MAG: lysylphosphatidylglycerol synthase transmembrane domain-containing protein [Balneolaceae bacterium]|nr:lysylphosphatidylglycerol synthase transmembrane domain-containing protein [Balneolaceae bacterium]